MNTSPSILYGICGIGLGHMHRQLPIISHLLGKGHRIHFFCHGQSAQYLRHNFTGHTSISMSEVEVPLIPGCTTGLDFAAATRLTAGRKDTFSSAMDAMNEASSIIGKPALVISDYEPFAASYGYAYNSPVVTLDQQSKYLIPWSWPEINGLTCKDEEMRLRMFFPKAVARIACSFFSVLPSANTDVEVIGSTLRNEFCHIAPAVGNPTPNFAPLLVYLSAQQAHSQPLGEMLKVLEEESGSKFVLAIAASTPLPNPLPKNVSLLPHGDPKFMDTVLHCRGVITTAGHSLLSELMRINKPVYCLPLPVYEQQMNAKIIADHSFGVSADTLSRERLKYFIASLPDFQSAIAGNQNILVKEDGLPRIRKILDKILA